MPAALAEFVQVKAWVRTDRSMTDSTSVEDTMRRDAGAGEQGGEAELPGGVGQRRQQHRAERPPTGIPGSGSVTRASSAPLI